MKTTVEKSDFFKDNRVKIGCKTTLYSQIGIRPYDMVHIVYKTTIP